MSLYSFVAVCLLPLLLFAQVPGSISIDPRLSWYTIESDHFDVDFSCRGRPDSSSLQLAREVADIAEEVHATLTPTVGWTPRARTQIIIADFYDYSNGWAAPFPNNVITIIPTPPGGSRTNEGDWLRTLILHEYSHILQIDRVAGAAKALRKVFGRIIMPNALAPAWLNEGYAVYNETRFTDFGRLRSAEYDMMARAAADSGRLLPVDRCGNYDLQRYPATHRTSMAPCYMDTSRARGTPESGTGTTAVAQPGFLSSRTTTHAACSEGASTTFGTKPRSTSSAPRPARRATSAEAR